MPVFEVRGLDGKIYEVDAADPNSAGEAIASLGQQAPTGPAQLGDAQGMLRQFANSASFGFDDELAGIVSAATGGDYQSARDAYNAESRQYADENPVKSFGAGLLGGLATGIGGAGKAAATGLGKQAMNLYRGTNALGRFGLNVAAGGASGALSGLGNAEQGERLGGALAGAAIGGATGGLVQPVAYVAKSAADSAGALGRWSKDRAFGGPEGQFARKLAQALKRDGLDESQVAARLGELGPNAMLADVSQNVQDMGRAFVNQPGAARRVALEAVTERAKRQGGRITKDLIDALDTDEVNFVGAIDNIHAKMREIGKGYEPIFKSARIPVDENITKLMKGPTFKAALENAKTVAGNDVALGRADEVILNELSNIEISPAKTIRAFGSEVPLVGSGKMNLEYSSQPTLQVWDYVKRGLDRIIKANTRLDGKLEPAAEEALQFKKALLSTLDSAAPEYKKIRSAYADEYGLESALTLGRAFFNNDAERTAKLMAGMSDPEKQMFRAGAARAARDKVLSATDTGAAYKRIFGNPLQREKLRAVFPDDATFDGFAKSMEREAIFSKTQQALTGNSTTTLQRNLEEDLGIDPISTREIASDLVNRRYGALLGRVAGRGMQRAMEVPEATRDVAAEYLFSTDPAMKQKALDLLRNRSLLAGRPAAPPSFNVPLAAALVGAQTGGN